MKVLVALGVGVALAALAAALYLHDRPRASTGAPQPVVENAPVLMVDDLRDGIEDASGEVEVRGVVGAANAERQLFGLIDSREVDACGGTDCPEFMLPVKWEGVLPAPGQIVSVKGKVRTTDDGLLLDASEVTSR